MQIARKARNLVYHWRHGGLYRVWQKGCERLLYYFYPFLSPERFVQLKTTIFTGYWAHIAEPRSFSEKVVHSKLYRPNVLAPFLADKIRVRQYVTDRLGDEILNELLWVGTDPQDIPFDRLPEEYVVKANHGAGLNIFVHSPDQEHRNEIKQQASSWMHMSYSQHTRSYESQYDRIASKLLIEQMMVDSKYGVPLDQKFFCFHGEPLFIQVDIDRFGDHRRNIYDAKWQIAPFELHYRSGRDIPRPSRLIDMLEIARRLSSGIDFCRVDLYLLDDKDIRFGEITLYPGGGFERFFPRKWDFELGKLWNINSEVVQSRGIDES